MAILIRTAFDGKNSDVSTISGIDCESAKDGRTVQTGSEETDINKIMARFEKTGMITVGGVTRVPQYGDFTAIPDYITVVNTVRQVNESFAALPAKLRARFENDPQKLIEFLSDPKNDKEAVDLKLKPLDVLLTAKLPDGTKVTPETLEAFNAQEAQKKAAADAAQEAQKKAAAAAAETA